MSTEMHDLNERLVDEEEGYLEVGEDGEKQGYFAVSESERAPSKIKVCGVSVCLVGWLVVCLFVCVVVCLFVWCANACLSMLWRQICNLFAHPLALTRVVAPDDDWLERAEDLEPGARLLG